MKSKLQNLKHQIPNDNHGITLVALIITIIVFEIITNNYMKAWRKNSKSGNKNNTKDASI